MCGCYTLQSCGPFLICHAAQMRFRNRLRYNSNPWGQAYLLNVGEVIAVHLLGKAPCAGRTARSRRKDVKCHRLIACTSLGFFPKDNCSGFSEKHLIRSCLETGAIFFLIVISLVQGTPFALILSTRCQQKEKNPRTMHMAQEAQKAAGSQGLGATLQPPWFPLLLSGFSRNTRRHHTSTAILSSHAFKIFRLS